MSHTRVFSYVNFLRSWQNFHFRPSHPNEPGMRVNQGQVTNTRVECVQILELKRVLGLLGIQRDKVQYASQTEKVKRGA